MKTKRTLSLFLAIIMVFSLLPVNLVSVFAAETAEETTTAKNITLGIAALKGGQQSNVYFGTYKQSSDGNGGFNADPIKWRVLSTSGGKAFLLSDNNLEEAKYHAVYENVTWKESTIRSWLNGYDGASNKQSIDYSSDNFIDTAFVSAEQSAIATTSLINSTYNGTSGTYPNTQYTAIPGGDDTEDKVFLLSVAEASNTDYFADSTSRVSYNTDYLKANADAYTTSSGDYIGSGFWFLRSPGNSATTVARIFGNGNVDFAGSLAMVSDTIRPAFNLDFSSVLLISAAVNGKPEAFGAVSSYDGNEWKLTVKDSGRSTFAASTSAISGNQLTVAYTNAKTGTNEYISAIIKDENGNVTYYGRLATVTAESGSATVTLPADFDAETDKLYIFNEQYNGDYKTDFASPFLEIILTTPTIIFDKNGGDTEAEPDEIAYGDALPTTNPTRSGYVFSGWYTKNGTDGDWGEEFTATTTVTADTTVYAKWLKEGTFTVIYKTNAEVEMGRVTYTVGNADNAFPQPPEFGTLFSDFLTRAKQKGSVSVAAENSRWYTDAKFTNSATFPNGAAGEEYTVYCKLTTNLSISGALYNTANNVSYSNVYGSFPAGLWVMSYSGPDGRSDADESVYLVFEKKNPDGSWTEVELSNTDASGTTWPNANFFTGVSDNGIYRLKHMGYTATDNDGTALFHDYATDPTNGTYTVQINPVEVTISGVTAVERATASSNLVALSGGTLSGVLTQDVGKVSFKLGTGTIADTSVGTKPVTTAITLTGEKAENYTLVQPTDVTVNIKEYVPYTVVVTNGTGGGEYGEGTIVTVKANTPESGKAFKEWTTEDGVTFADSTSAETTFVMPAKNVTVTATYEDVYDVWVDGVRITKLNANDVFGDGTVSYNAETNTLTLNNANLTSGAVFNNGGVVTIFAMDDLNIELKGTNQITAPDYIKYSRSISVGGDLTIFGSGSLTAIGGNITAVAEAGTEGYFESIGIFTNGLLTIRTAEVNAIGGTVSVTGNTIGADYDTECVAYSNGILNVNGMVLEDGAKLTATGGNAGTNTANDDYAVSLGAIVWNGDTIIYDAVLTAEGGKAVGGEESGSGGLIAYRADMKICDADAKVTLTGGDAEATEVSESNGVCVYGGDLDIQAGSVSVTSSTRTEGTNSDNIAVYVEGHTDTDGVLHGGNISLADGMKISVPGNGVIKKVDDTYYTIVDGDGNIATNVKIEVRKNNYSGGSSSSSITTTTTKNDDGSTTKTTTNKVTGTTTETTTYPDGSTTKVETKKDGTVTTIEKDSGGNTTTTTQNPDGTTTTEETRKDGTTVKTETTASGETTAEVKAKGETEVVIPVENAEDVYEVVVTDASGNETVITDFETVDGGIVITAPGNASVSLSKGSKKEFVDVHPVDHWSEESVDYVYIRGLMKGTSENHFSPDALLTRAMLVTVLYRLEGEPEIANDESFADVEGGSYYEKAVAWAKANGIVNGVSETEFAPNENITREQIAAIMHRYADFKGHDVSVGENTNILSYTDVHHVSEYAIGSMQYAVGSGLIKGKSESTLNPLDNATRAEAAAILERFIKAS